MYCRNTLSTPNSQINRGNQKIRSILGPRRLYKPSLFKYITPKLLVVSILSSYKYIYPQNEIHCSPKFKKIQKTLPKKHFRLSMISSPFVRRQCKLPVHQKTTPSPKAVTIPVHFVRLARKMSVSKSESALKIQKVFRGFVVRKSVKKILTMKREVDEIEKMISKEEIVESIRRDSKERLRVNETLMRLLLKLDSVRGVDSGVRDCRKTVIKKAIALQELVDAIAVGRDQTLGDVDDDEDTKENNVEIAEADQTLEFQGKAPEVEDSSLNLKLVDNCNSLDKAVDQTHEKLDNCNSFMNFETLEALNQGFDAFEHENAEEESVGASNAKSHCYCLGF